MTSAVKLTYRDLRVLRAVMKVEQTDTLQIEASFDGTAHIIAHPDDPERRRVLSLLPLGRVLEVEDLTGEQREVRWPAHVTRDKLLREVDAALADALDTLWGTTTPVPEPPPPAGPPVVQMGLANA